MIPTGENRGKAEKQEKQRKNKWDERRCGSAHLVCGWSKAVNHTLQEPVHHQHGCQIQTGCRNLRWLMWDHMRSAQRRCCICDSLPRLAGLVLIRAERLPRLVVSPHSFFLGLLQLLFSVWLGIFNLFICTKRRNQDKHLWPREEL